MHFTDDFSIKAICLRDLAEIIRNLLKRFIKVWLKFGLNLSKTLPNNLSQKEKDQFY
jgi:hypothetical protein